MRSDLKLKLVNSVYDEILNLLKVESRFERVGILFGASTGGRIRIESFVEMENLDSSARSFSIDYGKLVKEINRFQEKNKKLVGFFHSHPLGESTYPSEIDINYMKFWPSPYVWLIGASPNKLDAYTIVDDRVNHLKVEIKTNEC